jgi:hypothetical protein
VVDVGVVGSGVELGGVVDGVVVSSVEVLVVGRVSVVVDVLVEVLVLVLVEVLVDVLVEVEVDVLVDVEGGSQVVLPLSLPLLPPPWFWSQLPLPSPLWTQTSPSR